MNRDKNGWNGTDGVNWVLAYQGPGCNERQNGMNGDKNGWNGTGGVNWDAEATSRGAFWPWIPCNERQNGMNRDKNGWNGTDGVNWDLANQGPAMIGKMG